MPRKAVAILMLEDSELDAELTLTHLSAGGTETSVRRVDNRAAFLRAIEEKCPDVILADYYLPGFDGLTALELAQKICPDVPFIFVSGVMGDEFAIETLQRGATDYVLKQRLGRIGPAVKRALNEARHELESKHAKEELARKAHELMLLNGDLEQFAYIASHDLQEPLRTISIFSRLVSRKYKGAIDDQADEYLGYIESAAQHMSALIQDLLTYAKIPAQDRTANDVDLNEIFSQTVFLFRDAIARAQAEVTSAHLPVVSGNGTQLGLVFQSLVSNALKYRSAAPPRVHVDVENDGNKCTLSIKDNGIGFEPVYAQQIFGLFKRLEKTESTGTGLGLAICKRIIEAHGGNIWAESEPSMGCTFHFTLPLKRRHPETEERTAEASAIPGGAKARNAETGL